MIRRDILKAWLLAAGLAPPTSALAVADAGVELSAADAQRISALLYGVDLAPDDAEKVAKAASGSLANLKYLSLLKSDDVATPFGYPALIDEATRAP